MIISAAIYFTTDCPDNETYVNHTGYESTCSLPSQPPADRHSLAVKDTPPGCQCADGYFRDRAGDCVLLEQCGCLLESGALVEPGKQWIPADDHCVICECLMGSGEVVCSLKCDLPEVGEDEHLDYSNDSCCPTVVHDSGMYVPHKYVGW